ncbi:unnamed protein product [Lactuca saligna]|uniref:Uncharacterized protein n=1 Tax=Lactuca saligna TaxID=75948 RepID=A0AA35ZAG7_LACSI|nr:unnamed protein product [Lactuca saligna]
MKNISVILVAMVVFLAILEANASGPNLEVRKFLDYEKTVVPSHDQGSGKNDIPHLDVKEATLTTDKKWGGASGMTENNGQEKDSSTDTHHYFACAKQSQCGNEIHA